MICFIAEVSDCCWCLPCEGALCGCKDWAVECGFISKLAFNSLWIVDCYKFGYCYAARLTMIGFFWPVF